MDRSVKEENLLLLFSQSTSEPAKRQMLETRTEQNEAGCALSRHSKGKGESLSNASNTHSGREGKEGRSCNTSFHEFRASERASGGGSIVRASGALLHRLVSFLLARVLRVERARRRRRLSCRLGSIARAEATPEAAVGKGE